MMMELWGTDDGFCGEMFIVFRFPIEISSWENRGKKYVLKINTIITHYSVQVKYFGNKIRFIGFSTKNSDIVTFLD